MFASATTAAEFVPPVGERCLKTSLSRDSWYTFAPLRFEMHSKRSVANARFTRVSRSSRKRELKVC